MVDAVLIGIRRVRILCSSGLAEVLRGTFAPVLQFNVKFLGILVAIFGTTISPYLFFWQASQEVEEDIAKGKKTVPARQGPQSLS